MKPPVFATQAEADEWMERAGLFDVAMYGARQLWLAEDDTIIGYNTKSVPGGGFCSFRYRADGGVPVEILFVKHHSLRKAAKRRALLLYRKYAPKWSATHTDEEFA